MKIELIDRAEGKCVLVFPYSESVSLSETALHNYLPHDSETTRIKLCETGELYLLAYPMPGERILCRIDLGKFDNITPASIENSYGNVIRGRIPGDCDRVVFVIPEIKGLDCALVAEAVTEGLLLGSYAFDKYKQDKVEMNNSVFLYADSHEQPEKRKAYLEGINKAELICGQISLARDLINEPVNEVNPEKFISRIIETIDNRRVSVDVLNRADLEEKRFNGVFSVGKGSECGPYMAILKYNSGPQYPSVALVGKGVTLDVGGINLKTNINISPMRTDMAGAAVVLAVVNIISRLGLKINLYGILPLVENLIDGKSLKPGEIIHYKNGMTVEITNTDAEGRLVLADGILAAKELRAKLIIDIATLTSNIGQALGSKIAGIFGDPDIAEAVVKVGGECGEKFWRMPLEPDYRKALESDIADVANCGGTEPGAITASLFLERFAGGTKWAHIDIAATAYSSIAGSPNKKGATGFGIKTLVRFLEESDWSGMR